MKYWINTVTKNHVLVGVKGGFTQAEHGKDTKLKNLAMGDYIVFYSPKTEYKGGKVLQLFTAFGQIADKVPFQVEMNPKFKPWRRRVNFFECSEVSIRGLIDSLEFIKNKKYWGFQFRKGLFEIGKSDMSLIAEAMGVNIK